MGVKVATSCLHWSQPFSSPSLKRCSFSDGAILFKHIHKKLNLNRSQSHRSKPIRRSSSASMDNHTPSYSDDEFTKQLEELASRFQTSEQLQHSSTIEPEENSPGFEFDPLDSSPDNNNELLIPANMERKANSVDIPLSLRMIKYKRKKQYSNQSLLKEVVAGDSAYCSVKKAFANMVLIIRELQCFTLQQMRRFEEDLLHRVQREMHASFVWLFQQVFSHTPTLMVYVMILLANYSVHSMTAMAEPLTLQPTHSVLKYEEDRNCHKFHPESLNKTFSGKTVSIGGGNGGGGKFRPVSSGTDGDGRFDGSVSLNSDRIVIPEGGVSIRKEEESVSGQEEMRLWDSIVEAAMRMQEDIRHVALDHETVKGFVSPVSAKVESDDNYADYFRTELLYQMGLAQDPINPLLLANYAQFLYLVVRDCDRAEEYFKRAVKVEPPDAEALSKYASFLWQAKKDLWGAEETYLDAISADPNNSYYAANYAHFLWSTGGEDTCFPIDAPSTSTDDA